MNQDNQNHYWLDILVEKITKAHPEGELIVSSGISPSGPYHVGHAREILTADAVYRGLKQAGRAVRHLHFVDDIEALRKRYPYLPESYELEAGKPLYKIPAPDGKSKSYADQFFAEYLKSSKLLGVEMEVFRTSELYSKGVFTEMISLAMSKRDQIVEILLHVSGRELESDWQPIQILDESSGSLKTAKFVGYDFDSCKAHYIGQDGKDYFADAAKGQIKLDWRLDWPARWKLYGVQIEGFGREHATKGGSYDTGVVLAKEIFGYQAPIAVPYDNIALKGQTKKMSSSLGNLVKLIDSLEIIPAEILRYFTFKSRPERQLTFDTGLGLYTLIDEYAKTEAAVLAGEEPEFKQAWQLASLSGKEHIISTVPFSHMVTVYQTARGDGAMVMDLLNRTGFEKAVQTQADSIARELEYVARWLSAYAPDSIKFEVQNKLPKLELTSQDRDFLGKLVSLLASAELTPDTIHDTIYATATAKDIKPGAAFKLIYQLFLNKDQGPKLGFFLSSLDRDFVIDRLSLKS